MKINKEMISDFKKFTTLEKIICAVDLILNPSALDYPIVYSEISYKKLSGRPYGFIKSVKVTKRDGLYKMLFLRWI